MTSSIPELFALIRQDESGDFEGPQASETVRAVGENLEVPLPPSYVEFLTEFGAGDIDGVEVFGLVEGGLEVRAQPNVVWVTREARRTRDLPKPLVVVGESGDGWLYCIDTSGADGVTGFPVWAWFANGSEASLVAADFAEYLLERLKSS